MSELARPTPIVVGGARDIRAVADVAVPGIGRHGVRYYRVSYLAADGRTYRKFLYERLDAGAPTPADLARVCNEHEANSG